MKNVLKPSAKGVLTPLGLTAAAASATDAAIHMKIFRSGMRTTTLTLLTE